MVVVEGGVVQVGLPPVPQQHTNHIGASHRGIGQIIAQVERTHVIAGPSDPECACVHALPIHIHLAPPQCTHIRPADRQTDRQTDRHTYIHTYMHTDRQTDRQTDRPSDRQRVSAVAST